MSSLTWDPAKRQYELDDEDEIQLGLNAALNSSVQPAIAPTNALQAQADAAIQKEAMTGPGMLPGRGLNPLTVAPAVLYESAQTASNLVASVGTGLIDVGLMAVDATRLIPEAFGINKGGFKGGWKEIGDNQDNPLTAARIKYLRPKSGFLKGFNQMGEIVVSVITGPGLLKKVASVGIAVGKAGGVGQALKMASASDELLSAYSSGINKGFNSALDAIGNFGSIGKTGKITQLGAFAPKNRIGLELGKRARSADALAANQLDDLIASGKAGGGPLPNLIAAANQNFQTWKGLSAAQKLKVAGSVLAQDAFATFQHTGASPLEDETTGIAKGLSEASWVPSYAQAIARAFVPEEQDAALVQRAKMVAEGSILGFLAQPLIDAGRVAWMARGWGKANQQWKDEVVKILNNGDWSDLATESMLRLPPGDRKRLTSSDPFGKGPTPPTGPNVVGTEGSPRAAGSESFKQHPDAKGDGTAWDSDWPESLQGPPSKGWDETWAAIDNPERPKPAWEGMGATLDDLEASVNSVRATNDAARTMNEQMDELEIIQRAKVMVDPSGAPGPAGSVISLAPDAPAAPVAQAMVDPFGAPGPATATIRIDTPEPIVSLDAIREAVKPELQKFMAQQAPDAEALAAKWGEVQQRVMGLLPPSREMQVEYLLTQRPRVNAMGVMDAVDAMVVDNLSTRLLKDGAGRVDENFNITFNKTEAATLDGYDAVADEARQFDELVDNMPAAQQVVDVEAKPVAEQAPEMPTQVMGEEPAQPPIADQSQAMNNLNGAVDERAAANIQARTDTIKDLVRELEDPQALPPVTRRRKVRELDRLQQEAGGRSVSRTPLSDGLGADLDALSKAVGRVVRDTDEYTRGVAQQQTDRMGRMQAMAEEEVASIAPQAAAVAVARAVELGIPAEAVRPLQGKLGQAMGVTLKEWGVAASDKEGAAMAERVGLFLQASKIPGYKADDLRAFVKNAQPMDHPGNLEIQEKLRQLYAEGGDLPEQRRAGTPPSPTEELGQRLGELQVKSLDSQGEWDGRGLNRYEEPETALPGTEPTLPAIDPLENTFVAAKSQPELDPDKFVAFMESRGIDPYNTSPEEIRMLEQDYNTDQLVREQNMLDKAGEICDLSP